MKEDGKIVGAKMRDELTGEEWVTKAKCVVNATGPFTGNMKYVLIIKWEFYGLIFIHKSNGED